MMTALLINFIGLILIAIIIWWFLLAKSKAAITHGAVVDILVKNGVYDPAVIKARKGETLRLRFLREDTSPCSEVVIFEKLNVSAALPIGKPQEISFKLTKTGEFDFTCQMGMYRGKLVVA